MRIVIQRVKNAAVYVENKKHSAIEAGILILLAVENEDTMADIEYLTYKIARLRIFNDKEGKMNLPITDTYGQVMVVSQFTLLGSMQKGNRPSFVRSAKPEFAKMMYSFFVKQIEKELSTKPATGMFGADMQIELINDGPVTLILDSKKKDL